MSLKWTELGTSSNVDLFAGLTLKIGIANVTSHQFEVIEFGEKGNNMQTAKGGDRGINGFLGLWSDVTMSNKMRLMLPIRFDIENKLHRDFVVTIRWSGVVAKVLEDSVIHNLVHL